MTDEIKRLSIFFIDGTCMTVEFPYQMPGADPVAVASAFRKVIDGTVMGNSLAVEVGGDLILIPKSNIKYIRLTPGPKTLPEGAVIRGARIIQECQS
ncbi:MAG: hypothetical protein AB7S75_14730 [Desulfococcaceae bacterium]